MEHFYVITGNEYGVNLDSKVNFIDLNLAQRHFETKLEEDFIALLIYVSEDGKEIVIEKHINE